jgi:hypothetical protein
VASEEHSVDSACAAAERDELAAWVAAFLRSPGSDNPALADQLTGELRWWTGPVQLRIDVLHRLAGPPGAPVLQEVDDGAWRDDVDHLRRRIQAGGEVPPVVVRHRDDQLVLEDGNHRVEALRRAGQQQAWAVVGFDDREERDRFVEETRERSD